MVLHKDSKWYQQWKDFKDNNVVFNSESLPCLDLLPSVPPAPTGCKSQIPTFPCGFGAGAGSAVKGREAELTALQLLQAAPSVLQQLQGTKPCSRGAELVALLFFPPQLCSGTWGREGSSAPPELELKNEENPEKSKRFHHNLQIGERLENSGDLSVV